MKNYKYSYPVEANSGGMNINTPWDHELEDIKINEYVTNAKVKISEQEFPNGFKIKIEEQAHLITFYTSHPLVKNTDGSFTPDMDAR